MKKQCGFTLLELMVTLGVLALMVGIAIPSFSNFSTGNKKSAAINQLTGAFGLARSEAVTRNARMTLTATGADWANGWLLEETTSGTDVKVGNAIPNTVTVTNTGPTTIEFNSDGTLRTAIPTGFTITLCDSTNSGSPEKIISLIASGKYSVTEGGACP